MYIGGKLSDFGKIIKKFMFFQMLILIQINKIYILKILKYLLMKINIQENKKEKIFGF